MYTYTDTSPGQHFTKTWTVFTNPYIFPLYTVLTVLTTCGPSNHPLDPGAVGLLIVDGLPSCIVTYLLRTHTLLAQHVAGNSEPELVYSAIFAHINDEHSDVMVTIPWMDELYIYLLYIPSCRGLCGHIWVNMHIYPCPLTPPSGFTITLLRSGETITIACSITPLPL